MSKLCRKIQEGYSQGYRKRVIIAAPVTAVTGFETHEIHSQSGFVESYKTMYGFSIWYHVITKRERGLHHVPEMATRQIIEALYGELRPAILAVYEQLSLYDVEGATQKLAHLERLMFSSETEEPDL